MTAPDLIMAITRLIQGADNQSNNKAAFPAWCGYY
jgi:hypothetical protein